LKSLPAPESTAKKRGERLAVRGYDSKGLSILLTNSSLCGGRGLLKNLRFGICGVTSIQGVQGCGIGDFGGCGGRARNGAIEGGHQTHQYHFVNAHCQQADDPTFGTGGAQTARLTLGNGGQTVEQRYG